MKYYEKFPYSDEASKTDALAAATARQDELTKTHQHLDSRGAHFRLRGCGGGQCVLLVTADAGKVQYSRSFLKNGRDPEDVMEELEGMVGSTCEPQKRVTIIQRMRDLIDAART